MIEENINYRFFYWGPFLIKCKMKKHEINQIKSLCIKDKDKIHRPHLAGLIKEEYRIDEKKLFDIIKPYVECYRIGLKTHWNKEIKNFALRKTPWVNFMTKFESNPIHIHNGDISFVIYLQIPDELKEEHKNNISNKTAPGSINFMTKLNSENLGISTHYFFPEVGDIFIFPAKLHHYVNSFKSEGERISVSGNLDIIND